VENEIREREMRQRIDWRLSKSQEQVLRGALVWLGRKDLIEKKIVIARNWKRIVLASCEESRGAWGQHSIDLEEPESDNRIDQGWLEKVWAVS
jgi:hypothetical protein